MHIRNFHDTSIALVHDWLTTFGGAERVLSLWMELFPNSPIHTLIYDSKTLGTQFPSEKIIPSRLQRLPGVRHYYRKLLPLMPRAFEEFDMSQYDIVLSSSSSCAKGILTSSSTYHVSYVHSPMRYAWDLYPQYLKNSRGLTRLAMKRFMPQIRLWDQATANRVDCFLCNSREVARRIKKTYRRKATVIHPPIESSFFTPAADQSETQGMDLGEAYLCVGRLIPYKRIDLAVSACTRSMRRLDVIGDGPEMKRLKSMAGPTVRFLGFRSDEEIRDAYRHCRALLFPALEDFGMVPLETQACGRPVIAYGKGGALETVLHGRTGLLFDDQTSDEIINSMEELEKMQWHPSEIRKYAEGFSRDIHKNRILSALKEGWTNFQNNSEWES